MDSWCDFSIPIGLDHRCVHCVLQLVSPPKKRKQQKWNFKFWQPTLNDNGRPAAFQENIRSLIRSSSPSTFHELEVVLTQAGIQHGKIERPGMPFRPSMHLRQLRHRRRTSNSQDARKNLSLRIRKVYRCELRSWKFRQLGLYLGNASMWKTLRTQLPKPSGQQCTQQPTSEEFASMLEGLFVGPLAIVYDAPPVLEQPCKRLKLKKSPDETGLTAELLKAVPEEFLVQTLAAFNVILECGRIPDTWKFTTFRMLPKKLRAIQTTDFRPIASSRLFYKVFGYLILGRVKEILEAKQPEEQHGFRPGRRLEEHLLTANLLLDKAAAAGITVWTVSLDSSKAFDRVHWPTLWEALGEQGVPEHLVWLLENACDEQLGEVMGEWGKSRSFSITGGVRQGCVLSPRLFTAVLEWALRQWRTEIGNAGFDLGDALDNLVDLRFADDILLFANSGPEVAQILDKFVKAVGKVGLRLNVDKTVILTNEAQPPNTLVTKDGLILKVLERNQGQKWLGCILTACGSMMQHLDLAYHMEQCTKSMHANRWILQDKTTSIYTRLKYFNACVSAVVCFGGGHRTLYKKQLYTLDVLFRKLCRSIVTPPSDTDWSLEWHEILHRWNDRARTFAQTAGLPPWSYCVCRQHWKLASHIANLPEHRLVRRVLAWNPSVRYRSLGRRPHTWDYQVQAFCRYKGLGPWLEEAKYHHHWSALFGDFYTFCQM